MGWEKAGSSEVSGTWETSGWETSPIKEEKHFGDGILGYIREYADTSDGELRYGWLVTEFGTTLSENKRTYLSKEEARKDVEKSAKRSLRYRRKKREADKRAQTERESTNEPPLVY